MNVRLLLLEDSDDDMVLVVEALRDHGFDLEWERAETEEALRELLLDRPWDAVLCDYNMPHIKAEDAVEIVRSHDANLPFVLVSGTVDASVAVGMMRRGMHEYVMKDELMRLGPALEREIRDAKIRHSERIAKSELFALQKRFYDTFEQSSVGIAHLDRQSRVMWANSQLAEMLGYDSDDLVGLPCEKLTWPEDWPAEQERQQALLDGSASEYRIDKRYRRRDGEPIWTLLTLTAIKDETGEVSYLSAVVQDITEQKRAEERVRNSEFFTRAILDSLPFEVAVVDRTGIIRHVNTAWENFARENEISSIESVGVGVSYLDVCPNDLRENLSEIIGGTTRSLVIEYPCHSPREERWFLMQAAPLTSIDGGAVISHVDISSRVLTEQALERREREYRSIVETMSEGLLTLDVEGRLLFANRRFCEIVGYELSELRGNVMIDMLIPPEEREQVRSRVLRTLEGSRNSFQARLLHPDGLEHWVDVSTVPRLDVNGKVIGRLSVVKDITEKRAAAQEQDRLRRQVGELNRIESLGKLAGTMAHEFNNVLMGVQPFTEVIRRSAPDNQKVQQATQFVADAVQRGRRISQEILRYARPQPPERTDVPVCEFMKKIEEFGKGIVRDAHDLLVEPCHAEGKIRIDREQFFQVFTNLMINACDAMGTGGSISVRATIDDPAARYDFGVVEQPQSHLHVAVADTGPGMPREVSQKIFEPMFTTKRTGTGLGLAIVHQIVTAHGGRIFVDTSPGAGATFHLFLPLTEADTCEPAGAVISTRETQ